MASNDFLENAISSKIDEKSLTDLTNSLESSLPSSATVTNQLASSGLQPRLVVRTVAPVVSSQGTILQRLPGSQAVSQPGQVIRAGGMVMSGAQRLINPGGQVILAAPGQQLVRTSSGQILQLPQSGQRPGGTVVRGPTAGGGGGGAALQRVVINQPGMRPGQPGSQITVPLSTLQSLQAGQGIPTGTPGHLLVKTESGQYQILRVGQQNTVRLPTQPVARPPPPPVQPPVNTNTTVGAGAVVSPSPSAGASANTGGGMGQQMTPDTAKIKCKNFLATLLRLASDQPDTVATNVRSLIQGLIEGRVEPEVFTTKLQRELNSSPQPCLVPFLRKSLPYLQHSLATRELTIEGVTPPNLSQVGKLPPATSLSGGGPGPTTPPVVRGTTVMRPAVARPTLLRPGSASMPQLPTRPLPVQIKTAATHLMPPPGVLNPVQRDKKTGGAYSAAGDDDINDVAAMGGVNLAEEANRILGATDHVGSIIRSVKDESFLQTGLLSQRAARICKEKGLESPSAEVLNLISHATQERLKNLVSKLSVVAEHRLDVIKSEGPYVVTQDVKQQLRFIEDLDKIERKRHDEEEREILMKAAKSRTKTDDPEKEKLKAKAKEIQKDEADRIRYEEANKTALEAIGNVKKRKFGELDSKMGPPTSTNLPLRSRTKRVHIRDLLFLMEQEKCLRHSSILFKSYCS